MSAVMMLVPSIPLMVESFLVGVATSVIIGVVSLTAYLYFSDGPILNTDYVLVRRKND